MDDFREHFNIDVVRDYIMEKKFKDFVLCKSDYIGSDNKEHYFISPLLDHGNGSWVRSGCVYDNTDIGNHVIMDKDEMVIRFLMHFGFQVNYIWEKGKGPVKIDE